MDKFIIFRCPTTGLNVQSRLPLKPDPADDQRHYETVSCNACSRVHVVNCRTGKLLGYEKE
jgi:hypothetical protein